MKFLEVECRMLKVKSELDLLLISFAIEDQNYLTQNIKHRT